MCSGRTISLRPSRFALAAAYGQAPTFKRRSPKEGTYGRAGFALLRHRILLG